MRTSTSLLVASALLGIANAHLAAWSKGMYCLNGSTGSVDLNTASPVTPLYQLSKNDWWFHHINGCDSYPPADGDFLELPAGSDFVVEIASNRAKTSLSYNGRDSSNWPDGGNYPEDYNVPSCITSPNMHTQNQSMAAGTAFAISYTSDIKQVTSENLAVFTVRYHTPWKRITSYSVPQAMPACPEGGCICAWGWIPNGCGQPNMYHQAFRCKVTGATATAPIAAPKPPVWCEDDQSKCVKGAKQMLYWNQLDGNNIQVDGWDLSGEPKSPAYNSKCGFADGAQNDIFTSGGSAPAPSNSGSSSSNNGSSSNSGTSSSNNGSSSNSGASSSSNNGSSSSGSSTSSGSSNSGSPSQGSSSSSSSNSSTANVVSTQNVSVSSDDSRSSTTSSNSSNSSGSSVSSAPSSSSSSASSSSSTSAPSSTSSAAPQCKRRSRRSRRSAEANPSYASSQGSLISRMRHYHKRHASQAW